MTAGATWRWRSSEQEDSSASLAQKCYLVNKGLCLWEHLEIELGNATNTGNNLREYIGRLESVCGNGLKWCVWELLESVSGNALRLCGYTKCMCVYVRACVGMLEECV